MTQDERNGHLATVAAYNQSLQPALQPVPLPPQANRAALNSAQQETAFQNWVEHVLTRPAQTWDAAERNAVRVASARALKDLGY